MNKVLKGLGASPGKVRGTVKVFTEKNGINEIREDEILVVKKTDPTMVSIINRAAAIITDIGGITSHPAILSRELGIPCVVGTRNATTKLKNGMRVLVDGKTGEVFVAGNKKTAH